MIKKLFTLDDVQPLSAANRHDTASERREHNMVPAGHTDGQYDMELLAECAQSWNNKEDPRRERDRILRYLFGNQWGDTVKLPDGRSMIEENLIIEQGNKPLKNNVMVSLWMSVYGLHSKQETEPVCYARSEDSKTLSDMLSAALQTNWQNNDTAGLCDSLLAEQLASGMAIARETYEEREELFDSYTDYVNPYYAFWEGGSDPNHRDLRLIGCLHDVSRETLYFQFAKPEYGLTIEDLDRIYHLPEPGSMHARTSQQQNEKNALENMSFYQASDPSLCRVIEVWREEVKPRYQCFDPLATTQIDKFFRCEKEALPQLRAINMERKRLYDEQGVPQEKRAYITVREIVDKYWQYTFMAPDGRILCTGETPYDHKSHPFTVSFFPYINGEIHPFMGFFVDQQRFINRMVMVNDFAITNAAKGMTFLPLSLKPDSMTIEQYANQKTKFNAVFVYDDTKSRTGAKPEFFTHSAFNIGANEMLQTQLNMIHEVSGVSGALQGKTPTSGTSAARYNLEAQNATTTLYPIIKRFTAFKERLALKKCITMQQYYEDGRDITPKQSDKQIFYRRDSARNVQVRVSIKESASSAAYLQLGNQMLDKLIELGAINARTYIKHYDVPFADKILMELDQQQQQMAAGQPPTAPVQVPGADQAQAALATRALQGDGYLFTRNSPQDRLTLRQTQNAA